MHAEGIREDRLDDVTMADDRVDRISAKPIVPLTHRGDGAVLHIGHGLPLCAREYGCTRMGLHDLPHRILGEGLQRPTGPVAVAAFADPLIDMARDVGGPTRQHQVGGLPCALEGGCHDRHEGNGEQPHGQCARLVSAPVVKGDPWSPAGKDTIGVRLGAPVADQQDGGHARQRRSCGPVQHNGVMIRGMGLYTAAAVTPADDVRNWEAPGDGHPEPKLREFKEQCLATPGSFIWLGLFEPTRAELEMVTDVFDLPRLQVEDAANTAQRAKFEIDEDGHGLALLKMLDYVDSTSDVITGQLAVFVGPWYAITVRFGQIGDLRGIRERLADSPELREYGSVAVLYAVIDLAVDGYLVVSDEVSTDVENLETEVFTSDRTATTTNSIYLLKRENVEIRRAVGPLVIWAHDAVGERITWVPDGLKAYFRDIGDHLLRVSDTVESTDGLLMTMLMASTSLQDLQQNRDMRKISAWVAIAAVPTAIAAIYGMNFDYMPELHSPWGYPAVLTLMGTACVFLFRAFKRSGWL